MKKILKFKGIWVTGTLALALVLTATLYPAFAYFTTYTHAAGRQTIHLGNEQHIVETVSDWTKHVQLENQNTADCFVRLKAFAPEGFELQFNNASGKWTKGTDGYWYYSDILKPGAKTEVLDIKIQLPDPVPASFNVVVVQESSVALYAEDGTPYADWNAIADASEEVFDAGR